MKAYHDDMKEIDGLDLLVSLAESVSLSPSKTRSFLEQVELATEDVKTEAEENSGPSGAPFFILGRNGQPRRKFVFSGVQTPDTLLNAMKNLGLD